MSTFELVVGMLGAVLWSMATLTYWRRINGYSEDYIVHKAPIICFAWLYLVFGWAIAGAWMFTLFLILCVADAIERELKK